MTHLLWPNIHAGRICYIAKAAIEIKSTEDIQNKHLKGLRTFATEHPECRKILVSLDRITRTTDDSIEIMYVNDFLRQLWAGELF